jgi:cysteinyl-tRNA synthetase
MEIKLYNTLSRTVETFKPLNEGVVSMYHCGPTVYDTPHVGNYRTFVMNDIIRRVFEYNGYKVNQAMNITDVDDKTIRRSHTEGVELEMVTRKYEDLFFEGLKSLNIIIPHHLIRATDHITDMITLIEQLIDKGVAYKATDGVYMRIEKVRDYGVLAGFGKSLKARTESQLSKGTPSDHSRIANDEYDKDNPRDFALWKFKTDEDGNTSWKASFGEGRPGWHIECSAMSMKVLGPTIDIHTGAVDLVFPHHTNEIAQSESVTGMKFVNYWIHGEFLTFDDEKMAKSKGNFVKLETLADDMISPLAYRYWLMTAHYRSLANFTLEAVRGAQNALIKLMTTVSNLPDGGTIIPAYKERFTAFINDDMAMSQALALTWELLKDTAVSGADKKATILDFDRVFGLNVGSLPKVQDEPIPEEIKALAGAREEARKGKDWQKADALREEIENRGYIVSDTQDGIKISSK